MHLKYCLITFLLLNIFINSSAQELNTEERKLYDIIMAYRKEKGLPQIPISTSLTFVAQTHSKDLFINKPDSGECNLHSWSTKGNWSSCCYTNDHAKATCIWNKPSELTKYPGKGYEIAFYKSGKASATDALDSWKTSPGHNSVIINQGLWKNFNWNAIGIGIYKQYATVWFGIEEDGK